MATPRAVAVRSLRSSHAIFGNIQGDTILRTSQGRRARGPHAVLTTFLQRLSKRARGASRLACCLARSTSPSPRSRAIFFRARARSCHEGSTDVTSALELMPALFCPQSQRYLVVAQISFQRYRAPEVRERFQRTKRSQNRARTTQGLRMSTERSAQGPRRDDAVRRPCEVPAVATRHIRRRVKRQITPAILLAWERRRSGSVRAGSSDAHVRRDADGTNHDVT